MPRVYRPLSYEDAILFCMEYIDDGSKRAETIERWMARGTTSRRHLTDIVHGFVYPTAWREARVRLNRRDREANKKP